MTTTTQRPIAYRNMNNPVWCTGCGDYGVLKSFTRAFAELGLPNERIAIISGIGCSSRLPGYCATYGFNTVHGRSLPIATGLKVSRPDLTVLACGGDGDGFAIGIGHIPHAVRRNPDITYVVMDNSIYGLTKGQASPTTPRSTKERKGLVGAAEQEINPVLYVLSAGAGFVGRTFSGDMQQTAEVLVEAIRYPGFAFVHCLSPCVTYQGPDMHAEVEKRVRRVGPDYNPADRTAAWHIAQHEPFALGVLYRQPVNSQEFALTDLPVDE